jgi:hypothetical protein
MLFVLTLTGPATGAVAAEVRLRLDTIASAGTTVNFTLPTAEVNND